VDWAERPIAPDLIRRDPGAVLVALLLAGSLVPLLAMVVALFAAARVREGRREKAPTSR
jgi:hypothetical protein